MDPSLNHQSSFEAIVAEYEALIFGLILRQVSDREFALDLTQETFHTAYKAYPDLQGEPDVNTWIARIALNQCKAYYRSLPREDDAS